MELNLKQVYNVLNILLAAIVVCMLLCWLWTYWMIIPLIVLVVVYIIFWLTNWRCPKCSRHLGRIDMIKFCPHCGKSLNIRFL